MHIQTGYILSYIKYGDQDAILHAFTMEKGYQSFFLKGLYTPKNKKKAYIAPLNELYFYLNSKSGTGALPVLRKLETVSVYEHTDPTASIAKLFIADFLNHTLRHEQENPNLYGAISQMLAALRAGNISAYLIFLIQFLKLHGYTPTGKLPFLDPETGAFVSHQTHKTFGTSISELWSSIIFSKFPYDIKIRDKRNFLDSILIYCHYHYPEFRTPVSLDIIRQLF